jgi:hypothetical protein
VLKQPAPVTTVQRILQALDALLVKPLPAAAALQHLHEPLPVLPAVAVPLLRVAAMALVPRQLVRLQQQSVVTYLSVSVTCELHRTNSTESVTYIVR